MGCGTTKPFNLVFGARDLNGLPLNPEWAWQCDYRASVKTRLAEYPNPYDICKGFTYNHTRTALEIGTGCSSQVSEWDVPAESNWLYYDICHAKESFPFFPLEKDSFVHGHVNWFPVTYTGRVALENVGDLFSDGDTNLSLYPDASSAPQFSARTVSGLTPANAEGNPDVPEYEGALHLEYSTPEIEPALGDQLDLWNAKLAAASYFPGQSPGTAVAVGLMGLDNRHDAKAELHPLYALALREAGGPGGQDPWLVMFRNAGDEGGCSSQDPFKHELATPEDRITLSLPSPGGRAARVALKRGFLDAFKLESGSAAPITATLSHDREHTNVTVRLPPASEGAVLAGEITLTWTGRHGERIAQPGSTLAPRPGLAAAPATGPPRTPTKPATGAEPDELLVSLTKLLSQNELSTLTATLHSHHVPAAPARACRILAPAAERAHRAGVDQEQVELVQQLLKCK
jgi:hypothetical protein